MARISPVSDADTPAEVAQLWDGIERLLGRVPNFWKTLSHSPAVAKWLAPFVATLHREGAGSVLELKIKNLAVLKTSSLNQCSYCVAHNTAFGAGLGVTDETIQALETGYMDSLHFTEREKAAIWWAEEVTKNSAKTNKACFENLTSHFNEAEIVELTLIVAMFNMINRFNDSLHVDLEGQTQIELIRKTSKLPSSAVDDYARDLLAGQKSS